MVARLAGALAAVVMVLLVPSTAWAADETPAPEPTPAESSAPVPGVDNSAEPAPVEPSASGEPSPVAEPSATPTVTETVQPSSEPLPDAPGVGTGVYVDPSTGSVRVSENVGVALGAAAWFAAMVGGLLTARLVLP